MENPPPTRPHTRSSVLTLMLPEGPEGSAREVPLRYIPRESGFFVLAPAQPLPAWARALQPGAPVQWRLGNRLFSGRVFPAAGESETAASLLADLAAQHGRRRVRSWFGSEAVGFLLRYQTVREMVDLESLEAHFDALAPDYDQRVGANLLDAALRDASVRSLLNAYRSGDRVLEIGCGTGLETLALARAGVHVVAVDVSQRMLDRLREKAAAEGNLSRITPRKLRASEIGNLRHEYGDGSFQGAFSDFGALNLEPQVDAVPGALAGLVERDGTVLLAVWNRTCLMEMLLYALRLRPRRALARLRTPVPVGLSRFGLPAFAYAPGAFLAPFRPAFDLERLDALPFLVPPYDFLPHIPRPERLVPLAESLDRPLCARFPFNRLGDHFVATLRRR